MHRKVKFGEENNFLEQLKNGRTSLMVYRAPFLLVRRGIKKKKKKKNLESNPGRDCNGPMEKGHEEEEEETKATATLSDTINGGGRRNNARAIFSRSTLFRGRYAPFVFPCTRVRFENSRYCLSTSITSPSQKEEDASFPRYHGSRK